MSGHVFISAAIGKKLRERVDALRDGLRECVNGWRAAREANPQGFAESRREIEELRLRLVDLKRRVEAAISDPGEIDRGEQALAIMHDLVAKGRDLLDPPSSGYDWTPGGPSW